MSMEPDKWKRAKAKAGTSKKRFFFILKENRGEKKSLSFKKNPEKKNEKYEK